MRLRLPEWVLKATVLLLAGIHMKFNQLRESLRNNCRWTFWGQAVAAIKRNAGTSAAPPCLGVILYFCDVYARDEQDLRKHRQPAVETPPPADNNS